MIAKRIIRKSGRGTKQLLAYVVNEEGKGRGDPTTWKLAAYVLDADHGGEKVAWSRITNCESEYVGWAVKEILATQARNTRSKSEKSYHLVVSFPEGERPTHDQMIDIENEICRSIGFEQHQRISAVHQNTDNWHLHVAINKVHPVTLRNVEPYYDHLRLQEACAELEIKHGLARDNHVQSPDRPLNGRPAEMEAHAKRISFSRWIKEQAGVALISGAIEARNWQELHLRFARQAVVIKPRGAGLIITHAKSDRIRVKASDVDHSLSMAALTARFGPYQVPEPEIAAVEPSQAYDAGPIDIGPEVDNLWRRYCGERDAARDARTQALTALRAAHLQYAQELSAWYKQRYANAKAAGLNRGDRISTYETLSRQRRLDRIDRRVREKRDRETMKDRHPVLSWRAFLSRETAAGNRQARAALMRLACRDDVGQIMVETEIKAAHRMSVITDIRTLNAGQIARS
jgi:hypothetical protein